MRWLTASFMNLVVLLAQLEAVLLPISWLFAMGRWSAKLLFRFHRGIRRSLLENAAHLLGPESSQAQREALGRGVLTSFTRFFVELLAPAKTLPMDADLYALVDGMQHAEAARDQGRGVLCVTLHMGNYELGPLLLPRLVEQRVAVVYTPDPWGVFERLRSGRRQARQVVEIPIRSPLFTVEARSVLEEGGVVLAAADVGFAHQRGRPYPFLDGEARFLDWPAHLSLQTGAPLLPCLCYRDPQSGRYRFEIRPALQAEDADGLMRQLVDVFAEFVRRYPEQWLILHRYWGDPGEVNDGDG